MIFIFLWLMCSSYLLTVIFTVIVVCRNLWLSLQSELLCELVDHWHSLYYVMYEQFTWKWKAFSLSVKYFGYCTTSSVPKCIISMFVFTNRVIKDFCSSRGVREKLFIYFCVRIYLSLLVVFEYVDALLFAYCYC